MKVILLRRLCLTSLLLLAVTGCRLLHTTTQLPGKAIDAITLGTKPAKTVDPVELQLQVQRFADDYSARTLQALDEYAQAVGTESARTEALQMKLDAASSLVSVASGQNPQANLLDLVAMAEIARLTAEDYLLRHPNGSAFQCWVETSRQLETNAWALADQVLEPTQVAELRRAIPNWYTQNPSLHTPIFLHSGQFATTLVSDSTIGSSLSDLLNLDPVANLDPAVREVANARLFADRALFTAQRMPFLLRFQVELMSRQIASQPEVQLALTNTTQLTESIDRISRVAESVSQTAAQLPDRISAERKEILTALDQQQGPLKELAAQVGATLDSGEKMSSSLNTTLTTLEGLMKRFGMDEAFANARSSTNSHPFNIVEYRQTIEQMTALAQELSSLVTSVSQNVPQVERLSQATAGEARKMADHVFHLGLALIAVFLGGALITALTYRWLAAKLNLHPAAHESKHVPFE